MRIIAGKHKGRKLNVPTHDLRPTKDFTREALFNIVDAEDCDFLDLFSGSGSIGIEAISRYCKNSTFVDNNKNSIMTIEKNLNMIKENAVLIQSDVLAFLKNNKNLANFDLIYFDPPYNTELGINTLTCLDEFSTLSDSVMIVYEHSSKDTKLDDLKLTKLVKYRTKKYGRSSLTFFVKDLNNKN